MFNRSPEKARRWVETYGGRAGETVAEAVAGAEVVGALRRQRRRRAPGAGRGPAGHGRGRRRGRPHHHLGQAGARGGRAGARAGPLVRRRAGLRRPGGRGERQAHHHAGRRRGADRADRAGDRGLRQGDQADRAARAPGQLAKMCNQICIAGVVQGLAEAVHFAKRSGADTEADLRGDQPGRGPVLADGQPLGDHGRGQVRLRLRRRLDAQGPGPGARRGRGQRRRPGDDRRWSTASTPRSRQMGGRRWDTSSLVARLEKPEG